MIFRIFPFFYADFLLFIRKPQTGFIQQTAPQKKRHSDLCPPEHKIQSQKNPARQKQCGNFMSMEEF